MPYIQTNDIGRVTSCVMQEGLELDESYTFVDADKLPDSFVDTLPYVFINGVFTEIETPPNEEELVNT